MDETEESRSGIARLISFVVSFLSSAHDAVRCIGDHMAHALLVWTDTPSN